MGTVKTINPREFQENTLRTLSEEYLSKLHHFLGVPQKDNSEGDNILLEKGNREALSVIENLPPGHANTRKGICKICHLLASENPFVESLFPLLNENKQGLFLLCREIAGRNRLRKEIGGRRISNSQIYATMREKLIFHGKLYENG